MSNKRVYNAILKMPKMCHLHLHSKTLVSVNNLKKFIKNKGIETKYDLNNLIQDVNDWDDLDKALISTASLYDNLYIFEYIIENHLQNCYDENVIYIEHRGILNTIDIYEPYLCQGDTDEYVGAVYERVLIMLKVLYKWKLNMLVGESVKTYIQYYKKTLNRINEVLVAIKDKSCTNRYLNKYEYICNKNELMSASPHIQSVLLMNFKFILGQKGKIDRLSEYIKTANDVNKFLGYNFIFGYDMYAPEDLFDIKYVKSIDKKVDDLVKQNKKYSYFQHAGETHNDELGKYNIQSAIDKGCKRIGHGFQILEEKISFNQHVFVEVCPYSNHILGYYDIDKHPAKKHIYSKNVIVSISSDDMGAFGYDYLSVDYYIIYKKWKLNVADLYKLILNGILSAKRGGGIDEEVYQIYLEITNKWFTLWYLKYKGLIKN